MDMRAAVLWEQGTPLSVEAVAIDPPGPGEVLVEIKAAGVCHSDLHPARGDWPVKTPLILGHEGAGIVRGVGGGVLTGVGAVTNAARVPAGARVAVIGAGGVGLNVVQGCANAGCERIIAIDLRPAPRAIAATFGATDAIDASDDVAAAVRTLT